MQYQKECFCGILNDLTNATLHADPAACQQYRCPANNASFCGGFNAMAVYTTGLQGEWRLWRHFCSDKTKEMPHYVEVTPQTDRDVKILFLLQLNGRNTRQIKRLLKILYNPTHLYLVHVDVRQKYMFAGLLPFTLPAFALEMSKIQRLLENQGRSNFRVMTKQFATIWGGTSLLDMFLHVVRTTMDDAVFGGWDYVFNLSESDFPVLSVAELEAILAA